MKNDLETLFEIKSLFELQSDHSTSCLGYKKLIEMIDKLEKNPPVCKYCDKYGDAVDRNDLLEKYVEELADAILDDDITDELKATAKKYRTNLVRCGS